MPDEGWALPSSSHCHARRRPGIPIIIPLSCRAKAGHSCHHPAVMPGEGLASTTSPPPPVHTAKERKRPQRHGGTEKQDKGEVSWVHASEAPPDSIKTQPTINTPLQRNPVPPSCQRLLRAFSTSSVPPCSTENLPSTGTHLQQERPSAPPLRPPRLCGESSFLTSFSSSRPSRLRWGAKKYSATDGIIIRPRDAPIPLEKRERPSWPASS